MLRRLLTFSLLGLAIASQASVAYYRSYGPRSVTRLARPTVTWEVWPSEGARVTSTEMRLNGKKVHCVYSVEKRQLDFTPDQPLSPGEYAVSAKVTVDESLVVSRAWNFTVSADSIFHLEPPSESQRDLMGRLNDYRATLGVGPVTIDDRLDAAAAAHSKYLCRNHISGHYEQPGDPGFTGNTPSDRMEAYGYFGSSYEDVCTGSHSLDESLKLLFDAPYHRIPFMTPGSVLAGGAYDNGALTLQFGFGEESKVVLSPAPGQTNIPLSWGQRESPDPLRMHDHKGTVGYPIIFAAFGEEDPIRVSSARLKDAKGHEVEILLNTPSNDDHLDNAAILMAVEPLLPDSTYHVEVHATTSTGRDISKSWSFKTGA